MANNCLQYMGFTNTLYKIPVLVTLRDFCATLQYQLGNNSNDKYSALQCYFENNIVDDYVLKKHAQFLMHMLNTQPGSLYFILDGWDEVPHKIVSETLSKLVINMCRAGRFGKQAATVDSTCSILITSRETGFPEHWFRPP